MELIRGFGKFLYSFALILLCMVVLCTFGGMCMYAFGNLTGRYDMNFGELAAAAGYKGLVYGLPIGTLITLFFTYQAYMAAFKQARRAKSKR